MVADVVDDVDQDPVPVIVLGGARGGLHVGSDMEVRGIVPQNASPGTRTHPSISTRALRLMMAFFTVQSPLT